MSEMLPRRVKVEAVLSSRYAPGAKPSDWAERQSGIDVVRTKGGEEVRLQSDGGQPSPAQGWELMLMRLVSPEEQAIEWTLYGIPPLGEGKL